MKAQELRVNNYYESVKFNQVVRCDLSDFFELCARCDGALSHPPIDDYFRPIKLTEEWLVKFGYRLESESKFESKINDIQRIDRLYVLNIFDIDNSDPIECKVDVILAPDYKKRRIGIQGSIWHDATDIQYIHQLQNLYFALTGTELEIKDVAQKTI